MPNHVIPIGWPPPREECGSVIISAPIDRQRKTPIKTATVRATARISIDREDKKNPFDKEIFLHTRFATGPHLLGG